MYWLLEKKIQYKVREAIDYLVETTSNTNLKVQQKDQVFPFQGRKSIEQVAQIISNLTKEDGVICDPFNGSGSFLIAANSVHRKILANEYEPYTYRMVKGIIDRPDYKLINKEMTLLEDKLSDIEKKNYKTICKCGETIVFESLFFDKEPLEYINIKQHERLGENNDNIVYRGKYKCKACGAISKKFDSDDQVFMNKLNKLKNSFHKYHLIENSRINLTSYFTTYRNLFPIRSQLVSTELWGEIQKISSPEVRKYFENIFLSILPLMKFKDYRSKSQDLHCPPLMLRESNIIKAFRDKFKIYSTTIYNYDITPKNNFYYNLDFRDFLNSKVNNNSIDLFITDPPWNDGCAYFERAQLYHPWINYDLKLDIDRLNKEVIVSNAPSRISKNNSSQWWKDIEDIFKCIYPKLKDHQFLLMYFRPTPASQWIKNFNKLKLVARQQGFEPLITLDIATNDPSMRQQQSCWYGFSSDLIITFIKLKNNERRIYIDNEDLDELSFTTAWKLQDELSGQFTKQQWYKALMSEAKNKGLFSLINPKNKFLLDKSFERVCELHPTGYYIPRPDTPYSDEIFGTPYIERVSLYVPYVIDELLTKNDKFTFEQFLLKIAEFVENGNRSILEQLVADNKDSVLGLLDIYAETIGGGKFFKRRLLPNLPNSILNVLNLDPYEFEIFVAKLFEHEGYKNLQVCGRAGDRGVDIIGFNPNNEPVVIQCKRYTKSNIGSEPIQRLYAYAKTRGAKEMICVTTTGFTHDGAHEASITGVRTIARKELNSLINKHNMLK